MFAWLVNNIATILICAALLAVVTLVIVKLVKNKRAGRCSCGNQCAHCALAEKCHGDTVDPKGGK